MEFYGLVSNLLVQVEPAKVFFRSAAPGRENKPVSHNWKKGRGRLDLNQKVGNWAVKLHLT